MSLTVAAVIVMIFSEALSVSPRKSTNEIRFVLMVMSGIVIVVDKQRVLKNRFRCKPIFTKLLHIPKMLYSQMFSNLTFDSFKMLFRQKNTCTWYKIGPEAKSHVQ